MNLVLPRRSPPRMADRKIQPPRPSLPGTALQCFMTAPPAAFRRPNVHQGHSGSGRSAERPSDTPMATAGGLPSGLKETERATHA